MKRSLNPKTQQPYRVLWFGDLVTPSGFGRIGNEVTRRLVQRGYLLQGASLTYTGWPAPEIPFHVWPLGGQDIWNGLVTAVASFQPDLLISCQDFPYHFQIWHGVRIDFSKIKWMWITPIDGTPVHPDWANIADYADGKMVISRFGVEAMRQQGKRVALCHPGIELSEFYPPTPEEKSELRKKAGYIDADYIIGVVCMNQGRKAISQMITAFHEFARDKPNARLYLDMDKISPAGWDIPALLKQMQWTEDEQKRIAYREDLFKKDFAAFSPLRNRYALMDLHMVISHREGFGLPLLESMACRVPAMALDWCSGPEICGDGRGFLVSRIDYMEHGCWGGARDAFPDMWELVQKMEFAYSKPDETRAIAQRGYEWAIKQTWDVTTDQVEDVIQTALARERKVRPDAQPIPANPAPGLSDTFGPAHESPGRLARAGNPGDEQPIAVGGDPQLQPPERSNHSDGEPVPDGADVGAGGQAGDSSPG